MIETLVIRLRAAEDAPASWLIVDGNGARSGNVQSGPLADALGLSQSRRTCVVLPAAEVTLARPDLPPGAWRRAHRAGRAVRARRATWHRTSTHLHFAIGPRDPASSATPVAIVARSTLERWRSAWEAAGIRPDAAYAESSLLPGAPNALVLLLDEGTLHVCRAGSVTYALDAEPLAGRARRCARAKSPSRANTSRSTPPRPSTRRTRTRSKACARAPRRCRSSCCRTARCRCWRRSCPRRSRSTCCRASMRRRPRSARSCSSGACPRHSPPHCC